ncbi:hypothetical protein D9M68_836850 [compost metagenome]
MGVEPVGVVGFGAGAQGFDQAGARQRQGRRLDQGADQPALGIGDVHADLLGRQQDAARGIEAPADGVGPCAAAGRNDAQTAR